MLQLLLITSLAIGLSSVAGCAGGLIFRKIPHRWNDLILGGAAGVMLGAAILGLMVPAVEIPGAATIPMVLAGTFTGAILIGLLDRITPHLHRLAGLDTEPHRNNPGTAKVLLFVSAIALHKFPEGLAAGVSFGTVNVSDIITVAGSIALQNIPEAMVIVTPLLAIGVSMRQTMLISLCIGLISITGTVVGYLLAAITQMVMPLILSLAGGCMLYVVSDEMIPETHAHGYEKGATFSLLSGFLLVLILQQLLA